MEIIDPPTTELCEHAPASPVAPRSSACEECGSSFNMRSCLTCGHVGCCESQAGHARDHALAEHHSVMEQVTGGGTGFAWCYEESRYVR
ncbi:MAG TPA: UBP-type zinc finger domain-containing protein [Candidatus Limnocylindrales bacterium]|nr:UBP-type zinc finger domain-containing protein [Candidatus Limnocylindrales bacterium]